MFKYTFYVYKLYSSMYIYCILEQVPYIVIYNYNKSRIY